MGLLNAVGPDQGTLGYCQDVVTGCGGQGIGNPGDLLNILGGIASYFAEVVGAWCPCPKPGQHDAGARKTRGCWNPTGAVAITVSSHSCGSIQESVCQFSREATGRNLGAFTARGKAHDEDVHVELCGVGRGGCNFGEAHCPMLIHGALALLAVHSGQCRRVLVRWRDVCRSCLS